jgi:hypothetical protein
MKIDLPSLIIGIFALATFCAPIAWYQISEKLKVKKLNKELTDYAREENITLSNREVWGNDYALGIDQENKKLLYFKYGENKNRKQVIDLTEVKMCKVSNGTKTIKNASGSSSIISSIRLLFQYQNPKKGSTSLEIYDGENGKTLTSEITIANKLARTIRPMLTNGTEAGYKLPLI